METVKYIKLKENAAAPTYGTPYAAGADLYACMGSDVQIAAGETVMIHTGIAIQIPEGFVGLIYARSGIATKRGLAPANKVGVIDSDYRGEIMVSLYNHSSEAQTVADGERVAQLVIAPYIKAQFEITETLEETGRGSDGFGSTGRK